MYFDVINVKFPMKNTAKVISVRFFGNEAHKSLNNVNTEHIFVNLFIITIIIDSSVETSKKVHIID